MCRGLNRDVMVDLQFWHEDCFARNATLDARNYGQGRQPTQKFFEYPAKRSVNWRQERCSP